MEKHWWPYILSGSSVFFLFFWLVNPYVAWLLTLVISPLFLAAFVVAGLAEIVEKSRVPRSLFSFFLLMALLPWVWAGLFLYLDDFAFSWLKD